MSTLSDLGILAWEALWLPVFVWTVCMGALLLMLKAVPSKWIQIQLDLRLAGLMALVVGVVASWIFPLTPESTVPFFNVPFFTVANPLISSAPVAVSTPEVVAPESVFSAFTAIGVLTVFAGLVAVWGVFQLLLGGYRLKEVLSRSGKAEGIDALHSSVEVVVSSETEVAFSAGIFRRRIVLPSNVSAEDLPAVLAHELSHHTSGNIVRTWISHSVRALFFFHPLVHFIHSECQLLTEIACDRRILDSSTLEPRAYADLLVRSTPQSNRNAPILALAHSPSQLRKRITAMKNTFVFPFSGSQLTLLGALFVFLIGGLVGCTDFQVGPTETDVAMEGYDLIMELPEAPASSEGPFVIVEQSPTLIGGLDGLQSKIQYPAIAKRAGVEGRVFLQFVVQPDGSVTDAIVTRGIGAGCDEEALRMVKTAKFIPGVQTGMRVAVKMSLPVTFKLDENGEPITDPALLKAATKPPAPRFPAVDVNDIVVLQSAEEVDFEYEMIMVTSSLKFDDLSLKEMAGKNGADVLIMASPKNEAFFEKMGMKGRGVDHTNSVIGIRRK